MIHVSNIHLKEPVASFTDTISIEISFECYENLSEGLVYNGDDTSEEFFFYFHLKMHCQIWNGKSFT
jgi:hypothetical protein